MCPFHTLTSLLTVKHVLILHRKCESSADHMLRRGKGWNKTKKEPENGLISKRASGSGGTEDLDDGHNCRLGMHQCAGDWSHVGGVVLHFSSVSLLSSFRALLLSAVCFTGCYVNAQSLCFQRGKKKSWIDVRIPLIAWLEGVRFVLKKRWG